MNSIRNISIQKWIEQLQIEGSITFSLEDALSNFPEKSRSTITRTLTNLTSKGKVVSVWNGFYVIVPLQYASMGILPAVMYIDYLMKHLKRDYYVGLLNAASFYGAAHQSPQEFTVVTTLPGIRGNTKKTVKLNFITRKNFPTKFTKSFKTEMGYVNVSSAELTAIDLVGNEKAIGGLNRAATVLNDLCEVLDFNLVDKSFFELTSMPVIQRLGYIIDKELGFSNISDVLLTKVKEYKLPVRKTALKSGKPTKGYEVDKKWKIVINTQIEIDE